MKWSFLQFVALLLISCGNNSNQNSVNQNGQNHLVEAIDSVAEDTLISVFPQGYSKNGYVEYVPQNDIERQLLADLKEMNEAINNLDYKRIIDLYYPDYFKYLQKLVPKRSISEIKEKFVEVLQKEQSKDLKQRTTDVWVEANSFGILITNIMNRVKEGDRLLYLYEYHTILYSEKDTLVKDEAEYHIAASLNNGKKWYVTANSVEENFEILGISFSADAIDKVLTKK